MYSISRLGSNVTKATKSVLEAADQVQGYLLRTCSEGLTYKDDGKEPVKIQVFSDASYAPGDEESFGCFIVTLNKAPVFWRAGKQHMVTLSTAESELAELVEAMTAGESVASMVDELLGPVQRGAFTDSQAAAAIITTDGGSWRTRHLRTRASFARQSVLSGLWAIRHILGAVMVADIGTKPLTSTRLDCLKELMMMSSPPKKEEEQKFEEQKDEKGEKRLKEKGRKEKFEQRQSQPRCFEAGHHHCHFGRSESGRRRSRRIHGRIKRVLVFSSSFCHCCGAADSVFPMALEGWSTAGKRISSQKSPWSWRRKRK